MPLEWSPSSIVTSFSHILYFCCSLYIDNINSQNILHVNISLHFSYPDVMMPSYNRSRWFVIYFAVYIPVTLYFLMNLVRRNSIRSYRLWQYIEVFCSFHVTVQSPKLKVACNNFFCSQPQELFLCKILCNFMTKIIIIIIIIMIIIEHIPHALQKTVFNCLFFVKSPV